MATPSPTVLESTSRRCFLSLVSPKRRLPLPQHDREHDQPQLVDEVALRQRLHELRAAVHDDVPVDLALHARGRLADVAAQHRRVVPLRLAERGGDHVLGHGVELVGELALPPRHASAKPSNVTRPSSRPDGWTMATDQLSTTFAALADPTRRAILARLAEGEATVSELAEPFPISGQAVRSTFACSSAPA
jgi:hypothetical protein